MGSEANKAVVQRFWDECIVGGNVDVVDEVLSPNYVNLIVEGIGATSPPASTGLDADAGDKEKLKILIAQYHEAVNDVRFEPIAIAAEGDAVFARLQITATRADGTTVKSRGLAYYQVVDGKIVMNDLLSVPA